MNKKVFMCRGKITSESNTRMLRAAAKRRKDIVEYLINAGARIDCSHWRNNYTVLHYAARNGWLDIVQSLLKKGADIEVKSENGESPLVIAAENGHVDIFEFLLNAGANKNLFDRPNRKYTLLHYAAEFGWLKIFQYLQKKGFDVLENDEDGLSPLLCAAENGQKDIVELLVNAGADISCCKVRNNYTMLHYAAKYGWVEIIRYFLEKGADIEAKSNKGETPLQIACNYHKAEALKHLISAGADVNVESIDGETPLYFVIRVLIRAPYIAKFEYKFKEVAPLLINSGMFLKSADYKIIEQIPYWKEYILQDIELCSQAIINEFNHKDLPDLYKLPMACKIFPRIEKMRIGNNSPVVHEVLQYVKQEILVKGYCNVLKARPNILKILSVKSFLNYCKCLRKKDVASHQMKRLAEFDNDNQSTNPLSKIVF